MRLPETIERLYLDFDGFFASVEQAVHPSLRGRPVGVVPFDGTDRTCVIACSREAKAFGVKNVMGVPEARKLCPSIVLVPQSPDLYRRAHNMLLAEIEAVLPIDAVKSIDELTCKLDAQSRRDPVALAYRLKRRLAANIGPYITCSIGMAANRQLAKMASKQGKRSGGERYGDGLMIWRPEDLPDPLFGLRLSDIPGVGASMERLLLNANITTTQHLYGTAPKQMRKIWNNVTGERLWYALHGYDVQAPESERGMFGHGRVLPPESRSITGAKEISRLLLTKAARRLRRENYYAGGTCLWLSIKDGSWFTKRRLPIVSDDQAILRALTQMWDQAALELPLRAVIYQVGVTLYDLTLADHRQIDILLNDDVQRRKWESAQSAIDKVNAKYAATVVSLGAWRPPVGGHAGGKISYTRIPSAEDFW